MRSTTARRRIPAVATQAAVLAAVGALALTACSSGNGSSNASIGTGSGTSSTASSGAGGSAATGSGSSSAQGSQTSAQNSGGVHACTTGQLKAAQTNQSVGAGQYYSTLVFTNVSGTTCTLTGFPGVSYVKEGGVQSGNPAARTGDHVGTVTLRAHGGRASAVLHDSNGVGGYDPDQCQLSPAQGLRVYPPNQKAALFIPWQHDHCAGLSIHPLTIGPVTAG
ncbi:DUF4232 domain-containing protein [Streptantibioticus ferralitis]|uniref:DUF4232 domain-containing protein n=1 Tax=Streptantibioticus ferralitis TaxID=236510 RepID=A0ABT5Z878_9ACTN|nr:DUF4232 domain-containing protein [Streptantibioticus ferralitis]MDF2259847.1 DUF4232 domain-containing protein [Streptantibioticus ferralitis]